MSERQAQSIPTLCGGLRIRDDFFRARALQSEGSSPPRGIIDAIDDYGARDDAAHLARARIAQSVRAFFGDTTSLELWIEPRWAWWSTPFAWAWHFLARWLGQLCLPVPPSLVSLAPRRPRSSSSKN